MNRQRRVKTNYQKQTNSRVTVEIAQQSVAVTRATKRKYPSNDSVLSGSILVR